MIPQITDKEVGEGILYSRCSHPENKRTSDDKKVSCVSCKKVRGPETTTGTVETTVKKGRGW